MTTHPNALDRGVPYKDRLWPLNTDQAHLLPNAEFKQVEGAYLFVLRRNQVGKLTSFDSFARSDVVASNMESLMQLFFRAMALARTQYFASGKSGVLKYPFRLYLETVFESDEARDERVADARNAADGTHNLRAEMLREVVRCSPDELERVSRAQNGEVDHNLTTFMAGIDTREVVEYRFWLFCAEDRFANALTSQLKQSFNLAQRRTQPTTIEQEDRNLMKQRAAIVASGELRSHVNKLSAMTSDVERWALFPNLESYLAVLAVYTGDSGFNNARVIERCLDAHVNLEDAKNPAHPNNVFAPHLYLKKDLRHIYFPQAQLGNCCRKLGGEFVWRFPIASCVIEVPTEWMEINAFCHKFTPDYQARIIQPRLSRKHYPPIALLRKSTLFAQLLASKAAHQAANGGAALPTAEETMRAARERRSTDPLEEARAAVVSARQAGIDVDTDDEEIERRRADEEAEVDGQLEPEDDVSDLGLFNLYNNVRSRERSARERREDDEFTRELAHKFKVTDPAADPLWPRNDAGDDYAEMPEDGDLSSAANSNLGISRSSGSDEPPRPPKLSETGKVSEAQKQRLAASTDFGDPQTRKQERQVSEIMTAGASSLNSALDTLSRVFKVQRTAARRQISDPRELAIQYTIDQDACFKEYESACCSSTSSISAAGCTINRFMEVQQSTNNAKFHTDFLLIDDRLSTFGMIVSQLAIDFDKVCAVYSAHREATVLHFASFDTYRHVYDLHINVVFLGEAAVSKSYLLELQERRAIEGTARSINAKTAAAANISEDRDDLIEYYQEMKATWLCATTGSQAKPDANKEHDQFKERVGTCRVTTEAFHCGPDGRRTSILSRSSQIGNFVGASNLKLSALAPPVVTRLWVIHMLPMRSELTDMAEIDAAARSMAQLRQTLMQQEEAVHDYRMLQMMHYHVEKLIYVGGLAEPSLPVFNLYMPIFRRTLQRQFGIDVPIRTMNRIEKFLRVLVINEALYRVFVLSNAPFYGKQFNINQLKWVDVWLRDNQKMVFWLYEFVVDQYVNLHETVLVEQLRTHLAPTFTDYRSFDRESENSFGNNGGGGGAPRFGQTNRDRDSRTVENLEKTDQAQKVAGAGRYSGNSAQNLIAQKRAEGAAALAHSTANGLQAAAGTAAVLAGAQPGEPPAPVRRAPSGLELVSGRLAAECDFNYIKVRHTIANFAAQVAHGMRNATRPLSAEQIADELTSWTKRTLNVPRFVQNPNHTNRRPNSRSGGSGSGDDESCDYYPVMPSPNDQTLDRIFALRVSADGRQMYIASAMLFTKWRNPATAVVQACFDAHTPDDEPYVSGFQYRPDTPSLYAMGTMRRNCQVIHRVFNVSSSDAAASKWIRGGKHHAALQREMRDAESAGRQLAPWVSQPVYVVNCRVDEYATRFRLDRIRLPYDAPTLVLRFDPELADIEWRASARRHTDGLRRYPEDAYADLVRTDRQKSYDEIVSGQPRSRLHLNTKHKAAIINSVVAPIADAANDDTRSTRHRSAGKSKRDIDLEREALKRFRTTQERLRTVEAEVEQASQAMIDDDDVHVEPAPSQRAASTPTAEPNVPAAPAIAESSYEFEDLTL